MLNRCDDIDVILSYCHYNLLDTSLSSLIPLLKSKNIGIINASITGMGLLTPQGPPSWHPASENIKNACTRARNYCSENNINLVEIAVYYALFHSPHSSDITSTLIGMENTKILMDNINTIRNKDQNDYSFHIDKIREILTPVLNETWPSGLPENNR